MKIIDVIRSVIPTIFKRDVNDKLQQLQKELETSTIPILKETTMFFEGKEFRSKEVQRLITPFNRIVQKRQGNIITTIRYTAENIGNIANELKPILERNFKDATSSSGLTYRKAQYLQLIDTAMFFSEYARLFANYIIVAETAEFDPGNTIKKRLTPVQIKKIETEFINFTHATNILNNKLATIIRMLESVPDLIIDEENIGMVEATSGVKTVDPVNFGFISANYNPFYAIQMKMAVNDHAKYERALEQREMIRLRLHNLNKLAAGEPDPYVQKEIELLEEKVQKLDAQIAKTEAEYA